MAAELATSLAPTEADRLAQAEGLVRDHCGWHIAPARTESITVDGSGSAVLILPSLHVTAVTAVTDDGTLVDVADYAWDEAGLLTRGSGTYPGRWGVRKVVVELTHGYPAVPPAVTAVVQAVAQRAVDNPGSRPRNQVGPFSDSFSQVGFNQAPALALLDAEKEALSHYKLPPRP